MIRQNDYPSHEDLLHIDWHHIGALSTDGAGARADYLGASSAPDTYFDGVDNVLGASDSLSAYATYLPIIDDHHAQFSQLVVRDGLFDLNLDTMTATVTYTVEVAPGETIENPQEVMLRSAAYEDDITLCCEPVTGNSTWNHIGRALGTEVPLAIAASGETQQYVGTFAIEGDWNVDNLHVVAFPERDTTRDVLQAGEACRMYAVTVEDLDPVITSSAGPIDFDAQVTYGGCVDDDVVVSLDKTALPPDWDAAIVVDGSTFPEEFVFPGLSDGEVRSYAIRVIPGAGAALGAVSVETGPAANPTVGATRSYVVFGNTEAILYVNDDNGGTSQTRIEEAIANSGHLFVTHDIDTEGAPSSFLLSGFDAVLWNTGELQAQTINPTLQARLVSYLDAGGKFFLSSHGILNGFGTEPDLIRSYLRVLSHEQDVQAIHCTGVAADPIGDGLDFVLGDLFADDADVVAPNAGGAVWLLGHAGPVAVRYDSGTFQTVFMTPAIELVPTLDQDLLVERVLDWFFPEGATDVPPGPWLPAVGLTLEQNAPNPFAIATSVGFVLPRDGPASLDVFDVAGRRIVRLLDRALPAGRHSVVWNGRDGAGLRVASGVYLYRLTAGDESATRDMVLRR